MWSRNFFVFCVCMLLGTVVDAQQYSFRELSLKKGLPQSQVKAIHQDSSGFLWVGTLGGLAKFDGKKFEVFTIDDGLFNNRITFIKSIGNELFIGHENGISKRLTAKTFQAIGFHKSKENNRFSDVIHFKDRIFVSSNGGGLFELKGNQLAPISVNLVDDELDEFKRIRKMTVHGDFLFFATRGGVFHTENLNEFKLIEETEDWSVSDIISSDFGFFVSNYNDSVYFIRQKSNYEFDFVGLLSQESSALAIQKNSNSANLHLWVLTEYNTISRRTFNVKERKITGQEKLNLSQKNGLPSEIITSFYVDQNGVLWFGTEGKGLFQFFGESFSRYALDFPVLSVTEYRNGELLFGTLMGGLHTLSKMSENSISNANLDANSIWCLFKDSQGNMWFGTNSGLLIYTKNKWILWNTENQKFLPDNKISSIFEDEFGHIWIGTRKGIAKAVGLELQELNIQKSNDLQIVRDICVYKGHLLVATKTNLFLINRKNLKIQELDLNNFSPSFSSLHLSINGALWIGSEEGLYTLRNSKLELVNYTSKSAERFINFIQGFKETVIIGTNNGLFEFSEFDHDLSKFTIKHFDESFGLTGTETNIKSAYVQGEKNKKLWFGTSDGLFSFEPSKLNKSLDEYKPKLFLTDFQVNFDSGDFGDLSEEVKLDYNQNRLRFVFQILDLYFSEKVILEYRIGNQETWESSGSSSEIVFNQLASGQYELQVRALGGNGNYSDVLKFNFIILKPFYLTWWFFTIILSGLGLLVYGIIQYRIQQIRAQQTEESLKLSNRLNALEQQSLNASMNRHFIFNALNSIQYFINTQDKLAANKYLSKFAQLIRKNLDSSASGENKVTLAEEIQRLELYLSLESMRFSDRFDYIFDIDEEIDLEEIRIPSMLFQPFIENSIIHGILPNEDLEGKIVFSAVLDDNQIVFTITDNGVGYSKSLKEKKDRGDHFSHGTNITKSRIEVIRKISGDVISLDGPSDILDENGKIIGTKVVIKIKL